MTRLIFSFVHAFRGITSALNQEKNFRIMWVLGIGVLLFLSLIDFGIYQTLGFVFMVFLVLFAELLNCAVEKTCDLLGREYCDIKKNIKDFCAGSVLIISFGAATVFILMFFLNWHFIRENVYQFFGLWLLLALILSLNLLALTNYWPSIFSLLALVMMAIFIVQISALPETMLLAATLQSMLVFSGFKKASSKST